MRSALLKLVPARYWAAWAADFSCYLARCLLHWLKLNQRGGGDGGGQPATRVAAGADAEASAAAAAFAAEQSAGADCLPCVQLLSGAVWGAGCATGVAWCEACAWRGVLACLPVRM